MTYTNFTLETDADGIALITWDTPGKSMNVIDQKVLEEWEAIVDHVAADEGIKGAVITSAKKTFGAGADLTMLQGMLGDFKKLQAAAKDEAAKEEAAKSLFADAYRLNSPTAQTRNLRQAICCRNQRHGAGRLSRNYPCLSCTRYDR